jgi:hypothetical protein
VGNNQEELAKPPWMSKDDLKPDHRHHVFDSKFARVHDSSCFQTIIYVQNSQNTGFGKCPATDVGYPSLTTKKNEASAFHSNLALMSKNVCTEKWRKGPTTEPQTETQTMKAQLATDKYQIFSCAFFVLGLKYHAAAEASKRLRSMVRLQLHLGGWNRREFF